MNKFFAAIVAVFALFTLAACQDDAKVASYNISKAADNFEIDRRIVFYNGINGEYMLTIEGRCSIEDQTTQLEVTCKVGPSAFKKHFLGLSDNFRPRLARKVLHKTAHLDHTRIIRASSSCQRDDLLAGLALYFVHAASLGWIWKFFTWGRNIS